MDVLIVYLSDYPVGRLTDDQGRMSFTYNPDYVSKKGAEALSHALPLCLEPYSHAEIEPFLSNLLPDDIIRTRIGAILQIPRENTFALLKALGGDCAGAVSFLPEGVSPKESPADYRLLDDAEAAHILDNLEKRPLDVGEEGFRISGAGAQDKLIACFDQGRVSLPLYGTPSSHIIKNALRDYPDSVENEWFSMRLAAACGLRVASCEIAVIGGKRHYVTTRYDRQVVNGKVIRLHQEDFCQMLKVDPKNKYEVLGGPGLVSSFALLRAASMSATDTLELLNRVIFNFFLGNGDAHGKNFSVLYQGRQAVLSPAYDLMSTTIYPEVGRRMAMKIDGAYEFRWVSRGKFIRMGEKAGIAAKLVEKSIDRLARKLGLAAPRLARSSARQWPSACYGKIVEGIQTRILQLAE